MKWVRRLGNHGGFADFGRFQVNGEAILLVRLTLTLVILASAGCPGKNLMNPRNSKN